MRNVIINMTGFKAAPMFRLKVSVDVRGQITVGEDFENICNFFSVLLDTFANTEKLVLVKDRAPVALFRREEAAVERQGLDKALKAIVNRFRCVTVFGLVSFFFSSSFLPVKRLGL